jgi:hypothetical protein
VLGLGLALGLGLELRLGLALGPAARWLSCPFGVVAASELPPDSNTLFTSTTVSTSANPTMVRRRQ